MYWRIVQGLVVAWSFVGGETAVESESDFVEEGHEGVVESVLAEGREVGRFSGRWRVQGASGGRENMRLYQRMEWEMGWGRAIYFLTERDPGEARWADFAAFYAQWKMRARPIEAVVGDVRPGWGQGLLFGRSGSRGTPFAAFRRDSEQVGYRSSGENQSLRGMVLQYRGGQFAAALLGGMAQIDARVDEAGRATSLPESGVHVSDGEVVGRDRLRAGVGGLRLLYEGGDWQGGVSLQDLRFDREVDLRRPERTPWAFRGRGQRMAGVDGQFAVGGVRHAVEIGASDRGKWGGLAVLRLALGNLRAGAVLRHYDPGFHSFYGGALSASDMENEEGYLLLLEKYRGRRQWRLYVDQYRPLQPTYSLPVGGATEVWGANVEWRLGQRGRALALYQDRRAPRWKQAIVGVERSRRGRVEWRYRDGERQVVLRLEGRRVDDRDGAELGGMGSVRWSDRRGKGRYVLHLSRFATDSYAARIYEFEYDLPGVVSIRPLYGGGWRFYILAGGQWRALQLTGRYRYQQGRSAPHYWGMQVEKRGGP